MKVDPCLLMQKQIRENSQDLENYLLDLKNWEDGMKKKEKRVLCGELNTSIDKTPVTREDVDYVKAVYEDGVRQMKSGKWELAVTSFSKALRKYNKNPMFFVKRAKCYLKLNKGKEAESDCSAALALDPKILKAKLYRSKAREMMSNLRGACLDLQDITILDPTNQSAVSALEKLKPLYLASLGISSSPLFDEDSTTNSKEVGLLDALSRRDSLSEEMELTEKKIQQATIEKERGNKFVKEEKWEEAIDAYTKAIKIYPNDAIFYANRALCHLKVNEHGRAVLDCTMALRKNPRYVKAYFRRAAARKASADYWGARQDIKALLRLEPGNNQAKQDLEELNSLIERKLYAAYVFHETDCSSAEEDGYETAEDMLNQAKNVREISEPAQQDTDEVSENLNLPFRYVFAVDKPPSARSKKPLKRIPINFIDVEKKASPECVAFTQKQADPLPEWFSKTSDSLKEDKSSLKRSYVVDDIVPADKKPLKDEPLSEKDLHSDETKHSPVLTLKSEEPGKKNFKYIFPIDKKPHLRSKISAEVSDVCPSSGQQLNIQ